MKPALRSREAPPSVGADVGAAARVAVGLAAVALLVAVDVRSKGWAADELRRTGTREVAGGHVTLHYKENRGIAFGLLRDLRPGVSHPMLVGYATAVAFVLSFLLGRRLVRGAPGRTLTIAGLILLLSGTLGNLHDRLERGYVIDFIDYSARGKVNWPTFNVADCLIAAGIALCAIALTRAALRGDHTQLEAAR